MGIRIQEIPLLEFGIPKSRPCQQCQLNMLLLLIWFEFWAQYPGSFVPLAMFRKKADNKFDISLFVLQKGAERCLETGFILREMSIWFFSREKHLQGTDWSRNTKWQLDYEETSILYLLCSRRGLHQWTFTFYSSFLFLVSWLGFPPVEVFSFYKWSKFSGFVPSAIPTVITKEGLRYLMYNVYFNQKILDFCNDWSGEVCWMNGLLSE